MKTSTQRTRPKPERTPAADHAEAPGRAVASAFSSVIKDLQPSDREFCHARRASTALRVTLKRHLSIGILEEVRFGSQTKRTGIRGQTDVDMLFVLDPRGVTRNGTLVSSARVLDRVSRAIARR